MIPSIAELNNEAVSNLQAGDFAVATQNLKLAMSGFLSSDEQVAATTSVSNLILVEGDYLGSYTQLLLLGKQLPGTIDRAAPIQSVEVTLRSQSNQSWRSFLFERALLISDESSLELKSSAVLYNLALIYHLVGVSESASQKIMTAKRLYLLSLDLVKKHSQEHGSTQALLVSLAIANNLGEMYMQQSHDQEEAKKCFSLAYEILRHLDWVESATGILETNEDEYGFFYLNAMVRSTGDIVVASAA